MQLELNGADVDVDEGTSLHELIERTAGSTRGSAAAVDGDIVPRSQWASYPLQPNSKIELITAVQGG